MSSNLSIFSLVYCVTFYQWPLRLPRSGPPLEDISGELVFGDGNSSLTRPPLGRPTLALSAVSYSWLGNLELTPAIPEFETLLCGLRLCFLFRSRG